MTTDMPEERCLSAYYYGFQHTKDDYIDAILEAVAMAGKSFHSTSEWTEENDFLDGLSYAQLIQNKADEASDKHEELKAIAEKMASRLFEMVMASRTGNIDSPEIGDAETGYHKWHEEWESYTNKILSEYNNFKGGG
jgi:hypothetical protein